MGLFVRVPGASDLDVPAERLLICSADLIVCVREVHLSAVLP